MDNLMTIAYKGRDVLVMDTDNKELIAESAKTVEKAKRTRSLVDIASIAAVAGACFMAFTTGHFILFGALIARQLAVTGYIQRQNWKPILAFGLVQALNVGLLVYFGRNGLSVPEALGLLAPFAFVPANLFVWHKTRSLARLRKRVAKKEIAHAKAIGLETA